jgi:monoamine oxidase
MSVSRHDTEYDVCVIGAGLSGLTAARELARTGQRVLVLEARDRVGGRGFTVHSNDGSTVDVGGQWVGPTQHKLLALLKELNIGTYKQYTHGKHLLDINGRLTQFKGSIPKVGPAALLDLQRVIWKVDRLARSVTTSETPFNEKLASLDNITVAGWMQQHVYSKASYALLKAAVNAVFAAEPEEISFLFFLRYVRSAGGLMPLIESDNGAQDSRVVGGMGGVAEALAEKAEQHGAMIIRNSPVTKVFLKADHVRVLTADNVYGVHRVIVAMAPRDANRIEWQPPLPIQKRRLMENMPMGSVIKTVVIYPTPFWRDQGLSGEMVCDREPLRMCFDATPFSKDGEPAHGALVGFMLGKEARHWSEQGPEKRRAAVLDQLSAYFGDKAKQPSDYIEKDWCADEWTQGCYTGLMPAGLINQYGDQLRKPHARIHWAGTETASEWMGYFDGAIQAGQRAAAEVLNKL